MEQHVGRLHIPVDDTSYVSIVQSCRYLLDIGNRLGKRQRAIPLDQGRERAIGQVGHDQVGDVTSFTELIDRNDIGMLEGRCGVSFPLEPGKEELPRLGVAGKVTVNYLNGDVAM